MSRKSTKEKITTTVIIVENPSLHLNTWIDIDGCVGVVDIAVKSYDSASRSSLCLRVQGEELMIHTRLCVISIAIYIYIAEKDFIAMK